MWMLTASGQRFGLETVDPEAILLEDIAHHLAQINRYTGACSRPYSVAEHSLLVEEILRRERGVDDPRVLFAGLMHDAHESYTNDLSRPAKQVVGAPWREFEDRIEAAVMDRFGLREVLRENKDLIRWADNTALVTERASLMPAGGPKWHQLDEYPVVAWWRAHDPHAPDWLVWRQRFLWRAQVLQKQCAAIAAAIAEKCLNRVSQHP